MKVQEAKSKLKFYLIFTLVFWVALPLLGFIVFQLFDIPDSPALETGVSGFFGVIGFLWLIETFRSFKAIYVIIKFHNSIKYTLLFLLIIIVLIIGIPYLDTANRANKVDKKYSEYSIYNEYYGDLKTKRSRDTYQCSLNHTVLVNVNGEKTYQVMLDEIEGFYLLGQSKEFITKMVKQYDDDYYDENIGFSFCRVDEYIRLTYARSDLQKKDLGEIEKFLLTAQSNSWDVTIFEESPFELDPD